METIHVHQIAKDTEIYVIENEKVKKTTMYRHVMESQEMCTSPRGAEGKLFVAQKEEDSYVVNKWRVNGTYIHVNEYDTEEEAEAYVYTHVLAFDFAEDTSRDTSFYFTEKEAEEVIIQRLAEFHKVNNDVAESIFHHMKLYEQMVEEKALLAAKKRVEEKAIEKNVAKEYAKIIPLVKEETYQSTAKRVSEVLGVNVRASLFHAICHAVRELQENKSK